LLHDRLHSLLEGLHDWLLAGGFLLQLLLLLLLQT